MFEETDFSFYFISSTYEYSLKRCEFKFFFGNSDVIKTINEIIVVLKRYEKRKQDF